jgi:nicotinate phosphoribosyltransferase
VIDGVGEGTGLGLFCDLYELTMAAALRDEGRADDEATFELWVRSLPPRRRFLVACGAERAAAALSQFCFTSSDVAFLRGLGLFDEPFLEWLAALRFEGDVWAVADGEIVAPTVPLLSLRAPLAVGLLVETFLINAVQLETMIATKAAHVAMACGGRSFVDFSARRDHGIDAAMAAARASFIGGAAGTSLVAAAKRWGIPASGTMAHAYVMAHADAHGAEGDGEEAAFRAFLRRYGPASILLVDTYDTVEGTRRAVAAMRAEGVVARGVRLDSGDLAELSSEVREELDTAGFPDVRIVASGDLDEDRITELVGAGAPIDLFGVGTRMGTSADQPYLGMVYKPVEVDGRPVVKRSTGKATLGGRKQVWRSATGDLLALASEDAPDGARGLLREVVRAGDVLDGAAPDDVDALTAARERCAAQRAAGTPVVTTSAGLRSAQPVSAARPGVAGGR